MLRKEQPALARSATHKVGHAEGSGKKQAAKPERVGEELMKAVLEMAKGKQL